MKKLIAVLLLSSLAQMAAATVVSCPAASELAGTYETVAAKGFAPNKLSVHRLNGDAYSVALDSYWAPKPNDDGTLGTMGSFKGKLEILEPWSCVALLKVIEQGSNDTEANPIACFLLFRFVGPASIEVAALGRCDYFHGHRATPAGTYIMSYNKCMKYARTARPTRKVRRTLLAAYARRSAS